MKKALKIIMLPLIILILLISAIIIMFYNGIIWFNSPDSSTYPIRGVDVSHYQNEIDWQLLASQDISFAFIKATEGSGMVDECFEYNWTEAGKTDIYIGAYHFFSFDSSGITQAENFINTVPACENMLPPVIDLEFYGDKSSNPPSKEYTKKILNDIISKLKEHYGMNPIIYANESIYKMYLYNEYENNPIWIRNIIQPPSFPENDSRKWTFWQYSNRQKMKGYNGEEKFIDMNVFNGSREEFLELFNLRQVKNGT